MSDSDNSSGVDSGSSESSEGDVLCQLLIGNKTVGRPFFVRGGVGGLSDGYDDSSDIKIVPASTNGASAEQCFDSTNIVVALGFLFFHAFNHEGEQMPLQWTHWTQLSVAVSLIGKQFCEPESPMRGGLHRAAEVLARQLAPMFVGLGVLSVVLGMMEPTDGPSTLPGPEAAALLLAEHCAFQVIRTIGGLYDSQVLGTQQLCQFGPKEKALLRGLIDTELQSRGLSDDNRTKLNSMKKSLGQWKLIGGNGSGYAADPDSLAPAAAFALYFSWCSIIFIALADANEIPFPYDQVQPHTKKGQALCAVAAYAAQPFLAQLEEVVRNSYSTCRTRLFDNLSLSVRSDMEQPLMNNDLETGNSTPTWPPNGNDSERDVFTNAYTGADTDADAKESRGIGCTPGS